MPLVNQNDKDCDDNHDNDRYDFKTSNTSRIDDTTFTTPSSAN